jgi:two-component system, OmpR family, heavy metal sensor histidine kinase CusS
MSAKRPEPRSIASQLVWFFTLAAALLLASGLGTFYLFMVRHAFEEDNAVLADRIYALRATLKKGGVALFADEIKTLRETTWHVRLLDSAGQVLAQTEAMEELLPSAVFPAPQSATLPLVPRNFRRAGKLFSLASTRVENLTLQVGQDRTTDEEFTREFGVLLALLLGLGLIGSAGIASAVTRRGLRPLAEMTQAAARIQPTHLNERIGAAKWPRELQSLARAFDDMLERLEDSFTRLSQFSADLAHELRTPLANIRGEAEVALTRPRDKAEYREVIESSLAECQRLSAIVDNLLFLARAEAAERKVDRISFDGRAAIEKIANYYRPLGEERHITIICTGEGEVLAEPLLFDRALSNLLENSLRFTPEGGTISIAVLAARDGTEVKVSDTGTGIPAEHLPRVFDRFYRLDPARTSQGAGLGLALVKSILLLHGGSAAITSEPGRGTQVTLFFPAHPTASL